MTPTYKATDKSFRSNESLHVSDYMETYGEGWVTWHFSGSCPQCSYVLPPLKTAAPTYFENGSIPCTHCKVSVDLWNTVLQRVQGLSMVPAFALASLGAAQTHMTFQIKTGTVYEIDLTHYDIPATAKVLSVSYTPQGGGVMPIELHGNAPSRRIEGTVFRVVGLPLGEGPMPRTGDVGIMVVWIPADESDAWLYLENAFEASTARQYSQAMVFAQAAVEIALMPLLANVFRQHASADNVARFMSDALTYGHSLNVVLPYLCDQRAISKLPDQIRGALNKLRRRRNEIIHEGVRSSSIPQADVGEGLCAAAFGFEYVRYIQPRLLELSHNPSKG